MPERGAGRVRFGVVGCGSAALPVCAALVAGPNTALAQVYDRDLVLAHDLADRYGVSAAESLEALLENPEVDAVYVAVPHASLAPVARLALQAGKAALVEKPLALSLAEADELIALAEANGLTLGVFYELRYHAGLERARALLAEGVLGRVVGVRVQTLIDKPLTYWQAGYSGRSRSPWRGRKAQAGGGVVLMNTSHLLDAVWHLTGLEVTRVMGEAATLLAPAEVEVEDTATATLRFDNGALGSVMVGAHLAGARAGDEFFEVYGSQGQLRLPDPYTDGALRVFLREPWNDLPAKEWVDVPVSPQPVFARAVEAFARAVQAGQPAPINGHDARRVLATVLGWYTSAVEGRAVLLEEPVYAAH